MGGHDRADDRQPEARAAVVVDAFGGQVNLLLMALVAVDCLVRQPRWPRGVLVGLAAAVKLTPAAFVLFFLLRGDRRAAATALGSFLAVTGIGFALNPTGSVKYWTSTVFHPERIGGAAFESNQSISGMLVWVVPFLLVARPALAAGGVLLFLLAPHWWWSTDDGWTWLTLTVGNAYVWFALAMLARPKYLSRTGARVPSTNSSVPSAKPSATTPS